MIVSASRRWKKDLKEEEEEKNRGEEEERVRKRERNERKPLWPLSSSAESGYRLYIGARLQSPEKQIFRTFRLKCQRSAGIDFLLSSEWGDTQHPAPYRTVFNAVVLKIRGLWRLEGKKCQHVEKKIWETEAIFIYQNGFQVEPIYDT